MSDKQPPVIAEGAADPDDEVQPTAKSAEDRKAATALAKLDGTAEEDATPAKEVDHEAVSKAMKSLAGGAAKQPATKKEVKNVKVDQADVALLVDQLDLTKIKATELLKAHDGDAVKAMRAFITA